MPSVKLIKTELKIAWKKATGQSHLSSANWTQQYIKTVKRYQTGFIPEIKTIQTQS